VLIGARRHQVRVLGPQRLMQLGVLDETGYDLWLKARADLRAGNHWLPSLNRFQVAYVELTVGYVLDHCIPTLTESEVEALSIQVRILLCDEPFAADEPHPPAEPSRRGRQGRRG
jgi:hypothetical protein